MYLVIMKRLLYNDTYISNCDKGYHLGGRFMAGGRDLCSPVFPDVPASRTPAGYRTAAYFEGGIALINTLTEPEER